MAPVPSCGLSAKNTWDTLSENASIVWFGLVMVSRQPVKIAKCVHNVVKRDRPTARERDTKLRCGFNSAGIRRPRGQDRPLLA